MGQMKKLQEELDESQLPRIFMTNDPGLVVVLTGIHKLPVMGTMEADHFRSRHFIFDDTEELREHVELWDKLTEDKPSCYETIYHYICNKIDSFDMNEFNLMLKELDEHEA